MHRNDFKQASGFNKVFAIPHKILKQSAKLIFWAIIDRIGFEKDKTPKEYSNPSLTTISEDVGGFPREHIGTIVNHLEKLGLLNIERLENCSHRYSIPDNIFSVLEKLLEIPVLIRKPRPRNKRGKFVKNSAGGYKGRTPGVTGDGHRGLPETDTGGYRRRTPGVTRDGHEPSKPYEVGAASKVTPEAPAPGPVQPVQHQETSVPTAQTGPSSSTETAQSSLAGPVTENKSPIQIEEGGNQRENIVSPKPELNIPRKKIINFPNINRTELLKKLREHHSKK